MNRSLLLSVLALAFLLVAPPTSWADQPPPTAKDLAAAKQAYGEGKKLYEAGKFAEAAVHFEESYRLSRNAIVLYSLARSHEQAGAPDKALARYKQFLAEAPADSPQRAEVTQRVTALERAVPPTKPTEPTKPPTGTTTEPPRGPTLVHQPVDVVPPRKPLDITATVTDLGTGTVMLHFRRSGEAEFASKPMRPHGDGLIARIPGKLVSGKGLQYYIEVRDASGAVIERSGKATSPHLVLIEASATARFSTDLDEPDETLEETVREDTEDPILTPPRPAIEEPAEPSKPWLTGSRLTTAKWATTGVAAAAFGTSLVSFLVARRQADNIVADSRSCGVPPCREFDAEYDQKYQEVGERYDLVYKVTLGIGLVAGGVAGYLWYRDLSHRRNAETTETARTRRTPRRRIVITPTVAPGFAGAAIGGAL